MVDDAGKRSTEVEVINANGIYLPYDAVALNFSGKLFTCMFRTQYLLVRWAENKPLPQFPNRGYSVLPK